jgi:group I intron endonuclease
VKRRENMIEQGIYFISNNVNGKKYIGSSINLKQRERDHWRYLRAGRHKNKHLQYAWNKYGEDVFSFSVLEIVKNKKKLIPTEQRYLDIFRPEYNKCPTASNMLGFKHTSEAKKKQRNAKLASWKNPQYRQKMVDAHTGHNPSPETRKKIGDISRGSKNGYSKLTEDEVMKMKELMLRGLYHKTIASIFNISISTVNKISCGKSWAHVKLEEGSGNGYH